MNSPGYQSVSTGGGYYIGEDVPENPQNVSIYVQEKIFYPQPELATRLYLSGLTILTLYFLFRIAA